MELTRNRAKKWEAAGLLALAVAACAGCCAPLLVPVFGALLAWSGIAGMAAAGYVALAAALFAASAVGLVVMMRRRRRKNAGCGSTR
jgi:membrane protein implicated in regulation of membrane protease activity